MSAADHLREAIDFGCTRDDHDHVGAHRAEVLTEAADNLVAACPEHGDADEAWMDCPCEYADELRRMAAIASVEMDTPAGESTPQAVTIENYPGEIVMLRGLLGVIRVVAEHGDMGEVRRLLAEHASDEQAAFAEEKDTPMGATSTPVELLALATVLEITRIDNSLPVQLRRSYGYTDRWAICDRTGRRWHRGYGWVYEAQFIPEAEQTDTRYTLAEAVPLARTLASGGDV
ncbi:hypothetical protein [Streptomyces sp. NPDC018352]|uniref:hypothetical protein n=1 Tax=Streptomyces sp. NPDC018352 TaxID=3157194 RepID=UPI00340A3A35